jgi:hypothetical protein
MSQAAEKREGKPPMLKDKDFNWEDPLGLEFELTGKSAWCATPRKVSRPIT